MRYWIITDTDRTKLKLTTVALEENQFLLPDHHASIVETFCYGYVEQDGKRAKRDKTIDGYYFTNELRIKPPKQEHLDPKFTHFIR
jgi:hypothetical protein